MKQYLTFTFYILLFILLTACGSTPNTSQDSGAVSFNIKLSRPATAYQTAYLTGNDICIDYGVATVTAIVKDSSGNTITSGSWSCSAHQGTITGIPSGNNYTVKLEGKDSDNTVTWSGEKTGISISRGETTAAGTIAMTYTGTDKTAPEISSTSPSDGVVNVPVTSLLTATFSEKMAISSVNDKTFKLTNGTTPVSGSVTYDSNTKKAIFIPATNLSYSTTFTATITTGVEDMAGNNMQADYAWNFTTEDSPTSAPSAPTGVVATAGNGQATITWDAVTGATSYNIYWSTIAGVTINPDTDIIGVTSPYIHTGRNNGTTYYYVVTAANDIYGESDTSVEVSVTPVATDTTPPTGSVIINNNATYTNSTTVTLTLSATDSSGISQMCISNENTCTASSWETYTTSKAWTLTTGDGTKTVYVWFKDGAGNANETHNTDSITLDTTAPEISSTSPSDSAVNVPVTSLLTATFSEKMAISSVNSITFKLTNGTTPVNGSVTYDSNTKKAIFIPATNLSYSTTYTATITTGVEDMAGNNIQADKTWSFTTEDSPTTAPSAPTGVVATAGNGQTTITWDAVTGATSYNIYWSTTSGVTINPLTKIPSVTSPYIHTGSNNGTTYYYVVTAENGIGESNTSAEVSVIPVATDTTPPTGSVIINNNATYTNSTTVTLTLSATDSNGVSQMCISNESTCASSSWETYTTSKTWTLTAGDGIKTVYAWFKDGAGNVSIVTSDSITLATAPAAPTGVTPAAGNGEATISWDTVSGATSYNIYWSTTSGVTKTTGSKITAATSPYTHTGRTNGTVYYYVITAVNDNGESGESAEGAVTPAAPIHLPKTGQTNCYDLEGNITTCAGTGQDGNLQRGVAWPTPRFTDNGDGAVTDNLTGLAWTKDGNSPGPSACFPGNKKTWQVALDYVACLNANSYLGYTDWRLPNVNELRSLVHAGQSNSDTWLNTQGFNNVQFDNYWSSTSSAGNTINAWIVIMWGGYVYYDYKSFQHYVWPVRSGQSGLLGSSIIQLPKTGQTTCYDSSGAVIACAGTGQDGDLQRGVAWPNPRFTDNGDGTVTDNHTGLVWTKDGNAPGPVACTPAVSKTWQAALDYVTCLNTNSYLGYTDWRLPNINELRSLVHYGQSNQVTWLNTQGFNNVQSYNYKSSTSLAGYTHNAWIVDMWDGYVFSGGKSGSGNYVWPVRSGQ